MNNPEYSFTLLARRGGADVASIQAQPIYAAGLSKDIARESGEQFFRSRLSGQLTFNAADYAFIVGQPFDTEFRLQIWCNMQAGIYWQGRFFKTDCEFDEDAQTVRVTPSTLDDYTGVLDGIEREFDLIKLAPEIQRVRYDRRPMLQVYVPGESVLGCYLSGMWWEAECEPVSNENTIQNTFHFARVAEKQTVRVGGDYSTGIGEDLPEYFIGNVPGRIEPYNFINGGYRFRCTVTFEQPSEDWPSGRYLFTWTLLYVATPLYTFSYAQIAEGYWNVPTEFTMTPIQESGATGSVSIEIATVPIYCRILCNVLKIGTADTYQIASTDLVQDNKNYTRVYPTTAQGTETAAAVVFNPEFSVTPTEWGMYAEGRYYKRPEGGRSWYPVARSSWGPFSVWFSPGEGFESTPAGQAVDHTELRDAYPLASVISVLLGQITPEIRHEGTAEFSEFLYGTNPITRGTDRVFITPKSNIIVSQYDQPAQKAPITLRDVFQMLRDCFQCFWWIDGDKLRIEHIAYFKGGGQYFGSPIVGIDLTALKVKRNGKSWDFARRQYSFDKPDTEGRYEFSWMDDVSEPFEGAPIDIKSPYVEQSQIENISVSQFTSDVDYILLMPSEVSKDGFVLMVAENRGSGYELPYVRVTFGGATSWLQNGKAAFVYLQQFYAYDMPAPDCEVDGVAFPVYGVKQLKRQSVTFPSWTDPDLVRLVKTSLGNGKIQSLSVNLCSRLCTATLSYDTE